MNDIKLCCIQVSADFRFALILAVFFALSVFVEG